MAAEQELPEIKLDADNLYREETVTDGRSGSIRMMIPVTDSGERDEQRSVRYEGYTNLMTPAGSLPIHFELDAEDLSQALAQFPDAAKASIEQTMQELQEMRRQQSGSGLYVPGQDSPGMGGGGGMGGPGGMPGGGGGGIQF
ncbi:MAG: hypothetical protein RJQ08_05565 [Salinisphaeraceae bacterium]